MCFKYWRIWHRLFLTSGDVPIDRTVPVVPFVYDDTWVVLVKCMVKSQETLPHIIKKCQHGNWYSYLLSWCIDRNQLLEGNLGLLSCFSLQRKRKGYNSSEDERKTQVEWIEARKGKYTSGSYHARAHLSICCSHVLPCLPTKQP